MMYSLFVIFIMLATASLPWVMPRFFGLFGDIKPGRAAHWLPVLAGFLFFASFYLPVVHISSETTTFQQHFVGGGLYSALLFEYSRQLFKWKFSWHLGLVYLFAWVSALGVANEMFEFFLTKSGLAYVNLKDADWDLLANTLGAITGYFFLVFIYKKTRRG